MLHSKNSCSPDTRCTMKLGSTLASDCIRISKTGPFSVFAIATIASCEALPTRVSGARGVCAIFARVSLLLEFRHGRYAVTKFVDVYDVYSH